MRRPVLALLLVVAVSLLVAAGPVRAQQQSPPPAAGALGPVDPARGAALVERAVKALGGAAIVDAVRTLELRGRSTRVLPNGAEIQVETASYLAPPYRYRQDSKIGGTPAATVLNPDGAFMLMSGQVIPMPPADAAAFRGSARRNLVTLLQARKQPGYGAVWIGTATLAGGTAQLVNVGGSADATTLYIDDRDGRILRMSYGSPVAGSVKELVLDYSDHRAVNGGLVYPFSTAGFIAAKPAFRSSLTSVVVNGKIDEALFMAATAPPPSPPPPSASPRTN